MSPSTTCTQQGGGCKGGRKGKGGRERRRTKKEEEEEEEVVVVVGGGGGKGGGGGSGGGGGGRRRGRRVLTLRAVDSPVEQETLESGWADGEVDDVEEGIALEGARSISSRDEEDDAEIMVDADGSFLVLLSIEVSEARVLVLALLPVLGRHQHLSWEAPQGQQVPYPLDQEHQTGLACYCQHAEEARKVLNARPAEAAGAAILPAPEHVAVLLLSV
eukprot:767058-Hanusia_phi.AAC.9